MIHYHGGPITPLSVAIDVWTRRHAFVSFERPEQIGLAAEVAQSFAIDNGAFSHWKRGHGVVDVEAYRAFVVEWSQHPGFDWCLIPDVIDGDERANDAMIERWLDGSTAPHVYTLSVPVWHLNESMERLRSLACAFPRVALGSSGEWADIGTAGWWVRIAEAMDAVCDAGHPRCKLHGLRMLNPAVFSRLPFASADSTNVAQNHWRERQRYGVSEQTAARIILDRIEAQNSAALWSQTNSDQHGLALAAFGQEGDA